MESLATRLGSGSAASFSGRLPAPTLCWESQARPLHHAVRAYQTSRGAQAIAITWDESFADPDWGSDYTEGQAAPVQSRREFAVQQRAPKPLKINRDLLLVSRPCPNRCMHDCLTHAALHSLAQQMTVP